MSLRAVRMMPARSTTGGAVPISQVDGGVEACRSGARRVTAPPPVELGHLGRRALGQQCGGGHAHGAEHPDGVVAPVGDERAGGERAAGPAAAPPA